MKINSANNYSIQPQVKFGDPDAPMKQSKAREALCLTAIAAPILLSAGWLGYRAFSDNSSESNIDKYNHYTAAAAYDIDKSQNYSDVLVSAGDTAAVGVLGLSAGVVLLAVVAALGSAVDRLD